MAQGLTEEIDMAKFYAVTHEAELETPEKTEHRKKALESPKHREAFKTIYGHEPEEKLEHEKNWAEHLSAQRPDVKPYVSKAIPEKK
jgi:hypothetical protein